MRVGVSRRGQSVLVCYPRKEVGDLGIDPVVVLRRAADGPDERVAGVVSGGPGDQGAAPVTLAGVLAVRL